MDDETIKDALHRLASACRKYDTLAEASLIYADYEDRTPCWIIAVTSPRSFAGKVRVTLHDNFTGDELSEAVNSIICKVNRQGRLAVTVSA